ncbi:DPP IV N-terminal domain-containing protein [Nitrososphaera viennensis]|nr:DPP IV N-terminal domain-containing protein [Nitrososphaera viennensis]UVS68205.1 DPP IV N-terminal domain-containing protein [Nitrososphaera viennensis]
MLGIMSTFVIVLLLNMISSLAGVAFAQPSLQDSYQLTTFGSQPDWSPDGNRILFVSYSTYGPSTSEIWEINIDGSNPRLVKASDNTGVFHPKYSPDGKHIGFIGSAKADSTTSIFVANIDGSDSREYIKDNYISTFTWTPDGNIIYVQYNTTAENAASIKLLQASGDAGSQVRLLKRVSISDMGANATMLSIAGNIAVSENGTKLLFTAYTGPNGDIYSLDLSNGNLQKIGSNNSELHGLSFVGMSADGHTMFVSESGSFSSPSNTLYSVDLKNAKEKVQLSTSGNFDYSVYEKLGSNATIATDSGNSTGFTFKPFIAYAFADAYPASFDKDTWSKFGIYIACSDKCEPRAPTAFSGGYIVENGKYVKTQTLSTSQLSFILIPLTGAGIGVAAVYLRKRRRK